MTDAISVAAREHAIRAWRAQPKAAAASGAHPALAAALLFTGGTPADAANRLRRALRAERRRACRGDRGYDVGRHLALVAACAALGATPARGPGQAAAARPRAKALAAG